VLRDIINTLPPTTLNGDYMHIWFCSGQDTQGNPNYLIQYAVRNESTFSFVNNCPDGSFFLFTTSVPLKPKYNITGYITFPQFQGFPNVGYAPVVGAVVRTDDNSSFTITDENGFYSLSASKGNNSYTVYPINSVFPPLNLNVEVTNSSVQQNGTIDRTLLGMFTIVLNFDIDLGNSELLLGYFVNNSDSCGLGEGVLDACCGAYFNETEFSQTITFTEQTCNETSVCVVAYSALTTAIVNVTLASELDGPIFTLSKNITESSTLGIWRIFLFEDFNQYLLVTDDMVGLLDLFSPPTIDQT